MGGFKRYSEGGCLSPARSQALFDDVTKMGEEELTDTLTNSMVRVPRCHLLFAGLSCKTLSFMNNSTRKTGKILEDSVGCTGATFAGFKAYLLRAKPQVVIMENVPALVHGEKGTSNLRVLRALAKEGGYKLLYSCFSSNDFGLPQDRHRCWLSMLYVGDSESSHVHDISASVASGLMARFRVPPPIAFTLDEILLRTDSKEFNFWSDKHLASASAALEQKSQSGLGKRKGAGAGAAHLPKWEAEHAAAFKKAGLEWPPVISPSPSNAFTATLPQRSMECLLLDEWRFPRTSFKQRIVTLGQSMRRNWGYDNCCPCVVPRGLFWERSRQSPVWGWELLMLQGLEAAMCPAAHDFSNAALVDLAGSTGNCCRCQPIIHLTPSAPKNEPGAIPTATPPLPSLRPRHCQIFQATRSALQLRSLGH